MNRGPAAFDQRFASLTFHCDGRPDKAELDGTAPHRLEYWNVWFQPLTFAFSSKTTPGPGGIPCPIPGTGGLSLGSSVFIPSISSVRPQAVFTFKPNGNLVTRAEAASYGTVVSSLTIPPEIPVNGPGNVAYRLATRGKAYLNNPAAPNAPTGPGDGWINLFGALDSLRIPIEYLAELFSAGDPAPVASSLRKLAAMRSYMRDVNLGREPQASIPESVGMTEESVYEMYRLLAIAKYEDRYVIPKAHAETARGLEETACSLDGDGGPGQYEPGPFGSASGRPIPVAVETFHALKERQTSEVFVPLESIRVNLSGWNGRGGHDES
jgi:hypothetical protein